MVTEKILLVLLQTPVSLQSPTAELVKAAGGLDGPDQLDQFPQVHTRLLLVPGFTRWSLDSRGSRRGTRQPSLQDPVTRWENTE